MTFVEIYVFLVASGLLLMCGKLMPALWLAIQGKKVYRSGFLDIHFGWHLEFLAFMGSIVCNLSASQRGFMVIPSTLVPTGLFSHTRDDVCNKVLDDTDLNL